MRQFIILLLVLAFIAYLCLISYETIYYPSAGYGAMYGGDIIHEFRCDRIELNAMRGIRL